MKKTTITEATKIEKYELFLEICSLLYTVSADFLILKESGMQSGFRLKINDRVTSQESIPLMKDEVVISTEDSLVSLKETLQALTYRLNKIKTTEINTASQVREVLDALGI